MTEDDKRNCCLVEIQETEAKYYKTLEDIEKVSLLLPQTFGQRHSMQMSHISGHRCHVGRLLLARPPRKTLIPGF